MKALNEIPSNLRFAPRVGTYRQADRVKELFLNLGYQHIRSSYQMRINMDTPPSEPQWAPGITLRTYNPETDLEGSIARWTNRSAITSVMWMRPTKKA